MNPVLSVHCILLFNSVQPKSVIDDIKKGLSHSNPGVRNAAISLCGTIHLHMGPALRSFLEDEKPLLLQQIDAEIEKVSGTCQRDVV